MRGQIIDSDRGYLSHVEPLQRRKPDRANPVERAYETSDGLRSQQGKAAHNAPNTNIGSAKVIEKILPLDIQGVKSFFMRRCKSWI